MAYKNGLEGCLKISELKNSKERNYSFSYEIEKNIFYCSIESIVDYINTNYSDKPTINLGNLLNDLTSFKTAKDELELRIKKEEQFSGVISYVYTLFVSLLAVSLNTKNLKLILNGMINMGMLLFLMFGLYKINTSKKNFYGKLETVSNAIYILESIRDDIYNNPIKDPETRESDIEIDSIVDQVSEPSKYSTNVANVNEISEDEINEGTIEGKNKSIEK